MSLNLESTQLRDTPHAEPLKAVERALANLRFGAIQLILHEGRVVQIEVTERQRFT